MLSRTAANLYWLARYMERAENLARMLDVAERTSLMPSSAKADVENSAEVRSSYNEWQSVLTSSGSAEGYFAGHDEVTRDQVVHYLVLDKSNPSSIRSCIETARNNARAVRTALTADLWESLNQTWLDMIATKRDEFRRGELQTFLDWVKERTLLFSGGATSTLLRGEGYWFLRLGTFMERADSTARILDVKYHIILPDDHEIGGVADYYQWTALLRSFSASRSYYHIYRDALTPWHIAEYMILSQMMPRSLTACLGEMHGILEQLADLHGRHGECHRLAGQLYSRLRYARIDDIFEQGLHEFLTGFIAQNTAVGDEIAVSYLS
jgi:uncharacterized alpha-E superfamily protein